MSNQTNAQDFDLDNDIDDIDLATGSAFPKMDDIEGCLILIKPYKAGTRPSKDRPGEEYPWVETDTVVLQGPENGKMATDYFDVGDLPTELEGFQFTGAGVTSFLQQKMRKGVRGLGVLVRGEPSARNRTAPWVLEAPTPEQLVLAKRYAATTAKARNAKQAASQELPGDTAPAANPWS